MNALRYMDVVLVVVTAPVLALVGAPALGLAVGAVVWCAQRVAEAGIERVAGARTDVRHTIGISIGGVMGRAWLVALSILAVGLAAEREDGLAATLLVLAAFTVYFVNLLLTRALERNSATS